MNLSLDELLEILDGERFSAEALHDSPDCSTSAEHLRIPGHTSGYVLPHLSLNNHPPLLYVIVERPRPSQLAVEPDRPYRDTCLSGRGRVEIFDNLVAAAAKIEESRREFFNHAPEACLQQE
ncbi:uncharacterized protein METZ01_LOCUS243407, partial [marine metagenome]